MPSSDKEGSKRISVDLPVELIERFDELKTQWGLRRRGAVLERLLDTLFNDNDDINNHTTNELFTKGVYQQELIESNNSAEQTTEYIEDNSIVLINADIIEKKDLGNNPSINYTNDEQKLQEKPSPKLSNINLPGFVSSRAQKLKKSLGRSKNIDNNYDSIIHTIKETEVELCIKESLSHWISLYGNKPREEVIEAAMIWFAREIWPYLDNTQNLPFTWHAASEMITKMCPFWKKENPSFEIIIVMAGVLEDPFATHTLVNRIPTLIRRFVNSFKRRTNVTSFQTLESTMTITGALKLLGLPTTAGKSVSLSTVRDAYKTKALQNHPDSGGSTEIMRKINEAYQLLKDLYKKKPT
ncbi:MULTISPECIES: DnaJ domain-containing protein [Prochlorococcus]|uniref:Cyanobacteria-specific chaperone containing DNAJ domain n=1 Tax=Prochlorococcus marinus (strain SARG / CCMP1375 / SS120) TaxID=167539 RepID=Q7VBX9_PROMA|nr:DnaJ domain-containing protein [Prochlorococcus marinus]AAQ00008.1 cyanobacteria-specific chaperone containing DNAJ domain [Prochlorococcus marinus subsp. marinus str. CCMP1375]KGG13805.1 putative DnaJ domain-containing protein [Prochlorococcus marinus str. LG]KGG18940.1 putative DnaJ domain-containing protein [Prochlorococcus marinus str. SS2]KGG23522.1 putative DnaJ domain-containing protein [Prochlorococcus marinus str. SS35]KGG32242.1 putative DnaJ domain-containing protein [Prochloroco